MQVIMAWDEKQRLKNKKFGADGKIVEIDAFVIGGKRKNGIGAIKLHTCYVLVITERGGETLLLPFAKPEGGAEGLFEIAEFLKCWLADWALCCTDKCGSYIAWFRDNPEKNIMHFIVNHSQSKEFGQDWLLWLDDEDDACFADNEDGFFILEVSTQKADHLAGDFKMHSASIRGSLRENVVGNLKEFQWRKNHAGQDLWLAFCDAWGRVERELREGRVTLEQLFSEIQCDFTLYDEQEEFLNSPDILVENDEPMPWNYSKLWFCTPDCGWFCSGKNWNSLRYNHTKRCPHWKKLPSANDYRHMSSRCTCCCVPGAELLQYKKPWGTKYRKCKATKVKRRLKKLRGERKSLSASQLKKLIKKK